MPAGKLVSAYAYEVSPRQTTGFIGGVVTPGAALEAALDTTFDRSKIGTAPSVTFNVDTSTSPARVHPVRDTALQLAFAGGSHNAVVEALAGRLASAMDNRSKPSLLIASVHRLQASTSRRVIFWTFPQQQVFNLKATGGHAALELLEAFNRESSLRKVAMIDGPNTKTGMLTARVLDFQATDADRGVADLWIAKFLDARLQMSDREGTKLLARVLRAAHTKTRDDQHAQDQVGAAIATLRLSTQRWSIDSIISSLLSGSAAEALASATRPEERAAVFGIDPGRFDELVQYRRFTLDNGVVVSAPFVQVGGDGLQLFEVNGRRRLRAEGEIEEEVVRSRA